MTNQKTKAKTNINKIRRTRQGKYKGKVNNATGGGKTPVSRDLFATISTKRQLYHIKSASKSVDAVLHA